MASTVRQRAGNAQHKARKAHAQLVWMPTVLCVVSEYVELTPREIKPPAVFVGSCISSTIGTASLAGQSGNCACTALPLSAIDRLRYAQHCAAMQAVSVLQQRQHKASAGYLRAS